MARGEFVCQFYVRGTCIKFAKKAAVGQILDRWLNCGVFKKKIELLDQVARQIACRMQWILAFSLPQ